MKPNEDIRCLAKEKGVYLWEIALHIGVTEQTVIRWMRNEPMSQDHQNKIVDAINSISAGK